MVKITSVKVGGLGDDTVRKRPKDQKGAGAPTFLSDNLRTKQIPCLFLAYASLAVFCLSLLFGWFFPISAT